MYAFIKQVSVEKKNNVVSLRHKSPSGPASQFFRAHKTYFGCVSHFWGT